MDRRACTAPSQQWRAVDKVWGPGSWGRTDLSPRSSEVHRRAGGTDGLGQGRLGSGEFRPASGPGAIRRSMRCRASATAPPTSSKSAASSNGSMHQRATASSFPTMAGRMCCCTSRCCAATAIRPPMKARVWCANACSGRRAIRRSAFSRWMNSTAIHPAQMLPPRTHVSVTPTSGLERAQVKWFNRLRGFGFLTCGEGTPDIFVHMETLRRFGMTELRPGQYRAGPVRARFQGHDGGRNPAGVRCARPVVALSLRSASDLQPVLA